MILNLLKNTSTGELHLDHWDKFQSRWYHKSMTDLHKRVFDHYVDILNIKNSNNK